MKIYLNNSSFTEYSYRIPTEHNKYNKNDGK